MRGPRQNRRQSRTPGLEAALVTPKAKAAAPTRTPAAKSGLRQTARSGPQKG
jgi:hypothetical protein